MVLISWFKYVVILRYKEYIKKACQSELVEDSRGEAHPPWFDGLTMTPLIHLLILFEQYLFTVLFGRYPFKTLKKLSKIRWVKSKLHGNFSNGYSTVPEHLFSYPHDLFFKEITWRPARS